jgi:hypothetical protein
MSQPRYSQNEAMRGLPGSYQVKNTMQRLRRSLSRWLRRSFLGTMFDDYHPERHYMRGAGPKSRVVSSKEEPGSEQA